MIVTLTANPSIDRTMSLPRALERGGVVHATAVTDQPGGKGVNVSRVIALADQPTVAVLPADEDDPLVQQLGMTGVPLSLVPVGHPARVNVTVTEPDGTTTKINDAGRPLDEAVLAALGHRLHTVSAVGDWVVLAGSLPPEVRQGWYAELVTELRSAGRRVAVDTSGAALVATCRAGAALPDLLKPNSEELSSLTGDDPADLEQHQDRAEAAARELVDRGAGAVLLTLGASGAMLVTTKGSWAATPPPVTVRSTVGAGDSSLAGYLLAATRDASPADRLTEAVAHGSAAASLPGSTPPEERHLDRGRVVVSVLSDLSTLSDVSGTAEAHP